MLTKPLFHRHEALYCAQYRELKERSLTADAFLPGTPGTLHRRNGTGYAYCYRVFYPVPGIQAETLVGRADDRAAVAAMGQRMTDAAWAARQVAALRKAGFQVADKRMARLLVELHNLAAFSAGLLVVGELAIQAWLNELGVTPRSGRRAASTITCLQLGAQPAFLDLPIVPRLPFVPVDDGSAIGTGLAGLDTLRVWLGFAGQNVEPTVASRGWMARAATAYDYLLEAPESAAMLAGGHCIPVLLPSAGRLVWHTLFDCASAAATERAAPVRAQVLALAAALIEHDPWALLTAWEKAPATLTEPIRSLRLALVAEAAAHAELCDLLDDCLR
ncbi:hypothetical protein AB6Q56_19400 [Dechloromonas sp. ARDL1]|uniref:hypothetical protein n=1 Tax=Dechloromonas sp. ARDL1 TaxID=3322121 RepID=UPI003DA73C6B